MESKLTPLLSALYGVLFEKEEEAAFSNYRQVCFSHALTCHCHAGNYFVARFGETEREGREAFFLTSVFPGFCRLWESLGFIFAYILQTQVSA